MNRRALIGAFTIMVAALFQVYNAEAQTFTKPGFYMIEHSGWIRNATPNGDAYTCSECKDQIQVQIGFGPSLPEPMDNNEFMKILDTEAKREDFAKGLIRDSAPTNGGYEIEVYRTGFSEIGGIKVAQFGVAVEIGDTVSHDISMVGVVHNRITKITLNYFDGSMNADVKAKVDKLFSSIKFQ